MRVTLDTSILVRAHQNADGLARALVLEMLAAGHVLVLSASMLEEVERVMSYPRLMKTSRLRPEQVVDYLEFLSVASAIVEIDETLTAPIRDSDDVHVLQTAIAGKADVVCTLDAHFHEPAVIHFCESNGIRVLTDVELIRLIRGIQSDQPVSD